METLAELLSTTKSADDMNHLVKLKCLIFGPSGAGKSRLGAVAGNGDRVLIGLTEKQAAPTIQEANPNAKVLVIDDAQDAVRFSKVAGDPSIGEHFDVVVLDSLTDTMEILRKHYTSKQGGKSEGSDKTSLESWGLIIDATKRFIRVLRDAPIHVIVIALEEETVVDQIRVRRPLVLGKKLGGQLQQYFNLVGHIRKRERGEGIRHEVLFNGDESSSTKTMSCLETIEPPEPQAWIAKRLGTDLPEDVQGRVDHWTAQGAQ